MAATTGLEGKPITGPIFPTLVLAASFDRPSQILRPFPLHKKTHRATRRSSSGVHPSKHLPVLQHQDERGYLEKIEKLKDITRKALRKELSGSTVTALRLIDTLQRLGLGYHFEEEIEMLLIKSFSNQAAGCIDNDMFTASLQFRLLRHNGFKISSEMFDMFSYKDGRFKESLPTDTRGLLSLYEASYLGTKDEDILLRAMEFTKYHLTEALPFLKPRLRQQVADSLKLPRHLRMPRLESRNYIDEYGYESDFDSNILELAKLDFNMVQSLNQTELTEIFRWWRQLGLVDKLPFARDQLPECFLWTLGIFPEPRQSSCRIELTKAISILLVIDDIFDSFASLPDLVLFTESIRRWDIDAIENLPEYMKICYMALYNTTNDIAYGILKQHGWNVVSHLKRTWIDMFEAFLVEAKWFNKNYVPTLEEYLARSVVTGGTIMALVHSFFLIGKGVSKETIALMEPPCPKLFTCSGKILRLWDDLGTAQEEKERGDVAKSIDCYMNEQYLSDENEAREEVRSKIKTLWLELNEELAHPMLPLPITQASFNLARTAQVIYQHGDDKHALGVGDHVQRLIYKPIQL